MNHTPSHALTPSHDKSALNLRWATFRRPPLPYRYIDQFVRSSPLVIIPLLIPINIDMLFFQYAIFFYGYGVFLHLGFEVPWPTARHSWINTSYHHYVHHAKSIVHKVYHTGFMFQIVSVSPSVLLGISGVSCVFAAPCISPRFPTHLLPTV